jgi:DHA1 family bicyclomycin/chloramphenicol resistance-like MFS transporter
MLRPGSFALTLLLALLTGIGPLSTDMYVPSLPDIGRALHASTEQVQLTISSYLLGFATGQILYGPISDRFGRKPVMMVALVLYGIGSIICATTQSIEMLAALRFAQALGGAGAIVLARAVVRDLYSGVRAGRELSLMGSIQALAPILAPVIGGLLQTVFGWRASFILLVIFAVTIGTATARLLPETLQKPTPGPFSLASTGRMFASVLAHRSFLAHLGIVITTFVGLYAWVSGSSIVIQGIYGLSPLAFGATYAIGSSGYLLGTNIAVRVVMRHGLDRMIGIGTAIMAAGGLMMAAVVALGLTNVIWLVAGMTIYLTGMGLSMPQTMAGAVTPFPDRAGTASSLLGFSQQSSASIAAAIIGAYLGRSAWPVAGTVAAMGCLAFAFWMVTRRERNAVY